MPFTFILNDEEKVNSHGFRTLNKGIDLKRFKKNPVLLDYHNSSNRAVIGKWVNIRIEGSFLKADVEFDEEDEDAMKIKGKVERGFLKGCSMGLDPDRSSFELEPTGAFVLKKSELMEASIVSIPSNANAVKLFAKDGSILDQETIQLCLTQETENFNQNEKVTMKKIMLSMAALTTLCLRDTEDNTAVENAINKLAADHEALKVKYNALNDSVEAQNKLNAETLVKQAVVDGKLTADLEATWTKLAMNDFEGISKTLGAMKGAASLAAKVNNQGASEVKTQEDFFKLDHEAQLKFSTENEAEYKALFPIK